MGPIMGHIKSTCDKHCPFISFNVKLKDDFIDDEILEKMRVCDKAYKLARRLKKVKDLQQRT